MTLVQTASEWQRLPDLFELLAGPAARGCAGLILGSGESWPAQPDEVADSAQPMHWLSELLLFLRGRTDESEARRRRRLAALGCAVVLLDSSGTILEVILHPPDEGKLQRLANAAADMGLHVDVREETALPPECSEV